MNRLIALLCTILMGAAVYAQSEQLWGYSTDNTFKSTGYEYPADYDVAVRVPATLAGRKIVAFNLPVRTPRMASLKLWGGTTTLGDKSLFVQDCTGVQLPHVEYIRIDLNEPVTVPADGMFVGYSFTIEEIQDATDDTHPVGVRSDVTIVPGSFYIYYSYYGSDGWVDFTEKGRVSALQLFLAADNAPDNYVSVSAASASTVVKNTEAQLSVHLENLGNKAVNSVGYSMMCGGTLTTDVYRFPTALASGANATVQLPIAAPSKAGMSTGTLQITHVNGMPNEGTTATSIEFPLNVVSRQAVRHTVVEEVTGTGCSFCTSGYVIMEQLREQMPDVYGISLHWFNTYSPLYVADYDAAVFPNSQAPLCTIDRKTPLFDPYFGNEGLNALGWASHYAQALPEVDLSIAAEYTGVEGAEVEVRADVEFLTDLPDSYIAFVLTADGVTGAGSNWMQNNHYYQTAPGTYPGLDDFCAGGKYGQSMTRLTYNDVMVGSSWRADDQRSAPAFTSTRAGATASVDYTLSLPAASELRNAISPENLSALAIVLKADGTIANAARCKITLPVGVGSVLQADGSQAAYDLSGRASSRQGILISNGRKHLAR